MTPNPIRVLVVDDSPLVRRTIERLLDADPGVAVVGIAGDGLDALVKIRDLRPDVVTLDVLMPRLDGLKVLACVMRESPVRVLMLSSLTQEGADETLQALDLGAVDFIDKTALLVSGDPAAAGRELLGKIYTAAAVDPSRLGRREAVRGGATAVSALLQPGGADVVVVGASTGGPPALQALIPALPADFSAGVVVVQHIPAGFTRPLAGRIDAASALSVREAEQGDRVRPGEVLFAPGGRHLTFAERGGELVVVIDFEPSETLHRPSVDVTMQSAAELRGRRSAGVLLTGMGTDGAWGMWSIRARGGWTLAQSEESCVVYGMPRAAVELGAASEIVPLGDIAARLAVVVAGR
ncbi:MAG: protein-glutamate methylesterase/protein-glutamine glutaminase [Candidatus Methylomirabilia bacterium]